MKDALKACSVLNSHFKNNINTYKAIVRYIWYDVNSFCEWELLSSVPKIEDILDELEEETKIYNSKQAIIDKMQKK